MGKIESTAVSIATSLEALCRKAILRLCAANTYSIFNLSGFLKHCHFEV
jgi:hypothetical protein